MKFDQKLEDLRTNLEFQFEKNLSQTEKLLNENMEFQIQEKMIKVKRSAEIQTQTERAKAD